jgi:predicted ribosome quality control (RQC) complex YloA/Tae2 family protein
MKRELSVIDLTFLVKELQTLEGALVDKIYQFDTDMFIRIYKQELGKPFLAITKRFIFLTNEKAPTTTVPGFGQLLRKYLSRAKIKSIEQIPGQRIIKIVMQKEQTFHLYAELYGKANIMLCNDQDVIIGARERQQRKVAYIAPKQQYTHEDIIGLFAMSSAQIVTALSASQDTIQKALALYVGKRYANEICARAGIDPTTTPISKEAAKKIAQAVSKLQKEPIVAHIYRKKGEIDDITPFAFKSQKNEAEQFPSLSEAYASQYTINLPDIPSPYDKKIASMDKRISMQKTRMKQMQVAVDENLRKGELLYEQYQVVSEILEAIKTAKEKMTWKEIKEKLKGHPIVKKIDEKTGKITLEL